jgi:hypothetical protein
LDLRIEKIRKIRVINLYNPPKEFEGLPELEAWLNTFNDRKTPTFLFMDSNLHHKLWNPPRYPHSHPQSKSLIRLCGQKGFKIISEKGIPTFVNTRSSQTTIDLTWANSPALKFIKSCHTSSSNHGSDHQAISLKLNFESNIQINQRLTCDLKKIDVEMFQTDLQRNIQKINSTNLYTTDNIDCLLKKITIAIQNSIDKQKKSVNHNIGKIKLWWDNAILQPIVSKRNRARKWMMLSRSPASTECYQQWQSTFKEKVIALKKGHWRKFLTECDDIDLFKAYKYTKPTNNNTVAPLLNQNNELTSNKEEQAQLLFKGTSDTPIEANTNNIQPPSLNPPFSFPIITPTEINHIISNLPKKKAKGYDDIPNEAIKWGQKILSDILIKLFNACLSLGYFPNFWKHAITTILRKVNKDSYSSPNSYRPITLLSCLGKIFEALITKRITFWAERNNILAEGHFGGRAGRSTDDANLFLTSWIRNKWRDKKVVSALFLDVKSAFPSVIKERLIDTMIKNNSPLYLSGIILNLLSNRTTSLRMEDYISPSFELKCGLPQGSPLSPILYIIYNSSLLIGKPLNLNEDSISLGFIDDVTHLVADKDPETAILKLEKEGKRSLEWGTRHNAIFDRKKANFMLFTHRKLDVRPFKFGNISLPPSLLVKYLGIILDTKLSFKLHLDKVRKCGKQTVNQLARISRCSYGIGLKQSRNLIISVLRSRILFGSVIWATTRNKASIISLMNKIFNSASRTVLGMFCTTPIEVLLRESPLMNFFDTLKRKNHLFLIKKMTGPNSHPIKQLIKYEISHPETHHPSPTHSMLDNQLIPSYRFENIETIKQHLIKPWDNFTVSIKNFNIKKEDAKSVVEDQIEEISSRNKHLIFTDGSRIPENGTTSAAILNRTIKIACRIGDEDSALAFEAEVLAIKLGLDIIINKIYNTQENFHQSSKSLNFFIDNQATILSIAS